MLNVKLADDYLYGIKAVHLAVAGDVFDGFFLCYPFSHEMSWMRSGIQLSQFVLVFLHTFKTAQSQVTEINISGPIVCEPVFHVQKNVSVYR